MTIKSQAQQKYILVISFNINYFFFELKIKSKIVDDLINGLRDLALENSNEMSVTHVVKE